MKLLKGVVPAKGSKKADCSYVGRKKAMVEKDI